jgi:lysyl-tRNA synthetase class II
MDKKEFDRKLVDFFSRLEGMLQAKDDPKHENFFQSGTVEDLKILMEEFRVATEELHEMNEELSASQDALSIERQRYQDLFELG